ncbi:hypothetical protein F5Y15DRAFT_420870 [Xylariaceae sp. FL0016]|nr:hypothetical protein F5Y15DRAFT_420870 [Xylariaceae sp. FL0016]
MRKVRKVLRLSARLRGRAYRGRHGPVPPGPIEPDILWAGEPAEEHWSANYKPESWYHICIGEVLHGRYRIISKLGWGDSAAAWLARDLKYIVPYHIVDCAVASSDCRYRTSNHNYVSVKVAANGISTRLNESTFLRYTQEANSTHPGAKYVVKLLDEFTLHHQYRDIPCFVFPVLGPNYRQRIPADTIWLNSESYIMQDTWAMNVLCHIEDSRNLAALEEEHVNNPSPRRVRGQAVVYSTRPVIPRGGVGGPCLIDFGNARIDEAAYSQEQLAKLRKQESLMDDEFGKPSEDIRRLFLMWQRILENKRLYSTGCQEIYPLMENANIPLSDYMNLEIPQKEAESLTTFVAKWARCSDESATVQEVLEGAIFEGKRPP